VEEDRLSVLQPWTDSSIEAKVASQTHDVQLDDEDADSDEQLPPELQPSETIEDDLCLCFEQPLFKPYLALDDRFLLGNASLSSSRLPVLFIDASQSTASITAPPSPMTTFSSPPPSTASSQLTSFSDAGGDYLSAGSFVSSQQWCDVTTGCDSNHVQASLSPLMDNVSSDLYFMPLLAPTAMLASSHSEEMHAEPLDWLSSDFIPSQTEQ
jgi:hypothetical protein